MHRGKNVEYNLIISNLTHPPTPLHQEPVEANQLWDNACLHNLQQHQRKTKVVLHDSPVITVRMY